MKETAAQKFFRERDEKLAKKRERKERRKARLLKPKDMNGAFPHKPGIYKLINKRTGEVFVSYSQRIAGGIQNHRLKLKKDDHDNPDLQEDYNNGDRFNVAILKEYPDYDKEVLEEDAKEFIKIENSYNRGYNRSPGGKHNPNSYNHPGYRLDGSRNRYKL